MRLYGSRILRNNIRKLQDQRTETRDALLYDIDHENHFCRVKIQGTSTLVVAWFPENWEQTPVWLKPGNAVKINHTGGIHGRIELIGHGSLIPSPVAGDPGDPPTTYTDGILTGLTIAVCTNGEAIVIMAGTFQIAGTIYTVPAIGMSGYPSYETPAYVNRDNVAAVFDVDPGGAYRYDSFFVSTNLIIDKVNGACTTPPVFPTVPADHLLVGWLFRTASNTVTQSNVNKYYSVSRISQIEVTLTDDELTWAETTSDIIVVMKDQYGALLSQTSPGWHVQVSIISGNGTLSRGDVSLVTTIDDYTTSSSITFTYTRGGTVDDHTPIIQVTLLGYGFSRVETIVLFDVSGIPM